MKSKSISTRLLGALVILFLLILVTGCDSTVEPPLPPENPVDPADPNALTRVLVIPDARRQDGGPPPPTSSPQAPRVGNNVENQTSSNGSTVTLPFVYETAGTLAGIYLQVNGASSYFEIPIATATQQEGLITVPITLPTNVGPGQFCTSYCVYDTENRVSNIVSTCVDVLELGSGALQVSLSWNTSGTDIDLWVTDPSGTRIYYGNRQSPTEGRLDRDDVDGYGPENIFWLDDSAPDGEYLVEVDYYRGLVPTNYIVTVNAPGVSRQFTGYLEDASARDQVTVITKRGSNLSFSTRAGARLAARSAPAPELSRK